MRWNLSGTSAFGALRSKRPAESLPGPVTTAWHEVRVHLQRQPRVGVPEVLRKGLDALPGVQEHGRVEVPERVHAVLAGTDVLAALGLRDDACLLRRR